MKSKIGDRSGIIQGLNDTTATTESRASALNDDNYFLQMAYRCINSEGFEKVGKGRLLKVDELSFQRTIICP